MGLSLLFLLSDEGIASSTSPHVQSRQSSVG
jgi:hypothetical protein